MPERPAIRVAPVNLELRPALLRLRVLPAQRDDVGAIDSLLVLTVNHNNHAALRLYLRAGFHDSGELYHGGRSGPQHLLLRAPP
ncbi:hypothetical protein GCM10008098_30830 [Rhodanobacter panaciterrae]|uniref:Acetyltransferase (GNAT) family protein n=1 Tax=Rhodanobacter panaciterrae TaxID=490572 RepID=A0ABQ3A7W9_9GAMM|nr:hypothetical protein [Rhodanobacter panaciterrae]GGY35516.1 hypothetical protein GCM10008098_30830 [Rhodanobacter panaciterrae]